MMRRFTWWWLLGLVLAVLVPAHARSSGGGTSPGDLARSPATGPAGPEPLRYHTRPESEYPLIVLAESNPVVPIKGFDIPLLVVCDDGTIIDHRLGTEYRPRRGRMEPRAARALARELATPQFLDLPRVIHVGDEAGGNTLSIAVRLGNVWKRVSADGVLRDDSTGTIDRASIFHPACHGPPSLEAFASAYDALSTLEVPGAAPVAPTEMEVIFWDGARAPAAVTWPTDIRQPPRTLRTDGVLQHFVTVESGTEARLLDLAQRAAGKAVLVHGQKWAMSARGALYHDDYVRGLLDASSDPYPPDRCENLGTAKWSAKYTSDQPTGPLVEAPGIAGLQHRPLIYLLSRDPTALVIGSDEPTLVVYEDGLVIQNRVHRRRIERRKGRLSATQARALAQQIAANGFLELPQRMTAHPGWHEPTTTIGVRQGERWKWASVAGLRLDELPRDAPRLDAFAAIYCVLWSLALPNAELWMPEEIDVLLGDYSSAKRAVAWPPDVPPPPTTLKPRALGEGVYKHRIEGTYAPALIELLEDTAGQAVLLNGEKWSVALRRRVPEEDYIRAAMRGEPRSIEER